MEERIKSGEGLGLRVEEFYIQKLVGEGRVSKGV